MDSIVWELPRKSQEFNEWPKITQRSGVVLIAYDFEGEDGNYDWEEIAFAGVVAFKFTAAAHCPKAQVSAYATLQAVTSSSWRAELRDVTTSVRHYRIYFDDIGCYETLATGFVPPFEG